MIIKTMRIKEMSLSLKIDPNLKGKNAVFHDICMLFFLHW